MATQDQKDGFVEREVVFPDHSSYRFVHSADRGELLRLEWPAPRPNTFGMSMDLVIRELKKTGWNELILPEFSDLPPIIAIDMSLTLLRDRPVEMMRFELSVWNRMPKVLELARRLNIRHPSWCSTISLDEFPAFYEAFMFCEGDLSKRVRAVLMSEPATAAQVHKLLGTGVTERVELADVTYVLTRMIEKGVVMKREEDQHYVLVKAGERQDSHKRKNEF